VPESTAHALEGRNCGHFAGGGRLESKYGSPWTRDELVLALYLYCQIPFAKTKANNPDVIELAKLLGRTPASVARKLGNFGAFDSRLAQRGVSGLEHFGKNDLIVWNEFQNNWDELVSESCQLLARTTPASDAFSPELDSALRIPEGPTTVTRAVVVRIGQQFFRRAVLSSYQYQCCICELDIPALLVASHIVPWSRRLDIRLDPTNGLALCVLHDCAFDRGLLTIDRDLCVRIKPNVLRMTSTAVSQMLTAYNGRTIVRPSRFAPLPEYLVWHQQHVYVDMA